MDEECGERWFDMKKKRKKRVQKKTFMISQTIETQNVGILFFKFG